MANVSFAMNKAELIEAIAKEAKLTKMQAELIVELTECKSATDPAVGAEDEPKGATDIFCKIDGIDDIMKDKRIASAGIDPQKAQAAIMALQRILVTDAQARVIMQEGTRPNSISPKRVQDYWTPERMRSAKPIPLGVVDESSAGKKENAAGPEAELELENETERKTMHLKYQRRLKNHEYENERRSDIDKHNTTTNAIRNTSEVRSNPFPFEKRFKSETAKKVLQEILENKIPCANCDGVEQLPEQEIEKLAKAKEKIQKEGWKLKVEGDKAKVKRVQKKRLFFLFEVELEEEAELDENGQIKDIKKPWWAIFVW